MKAHTSLPSVQSPSHTGIERGPSKKLQNARDLFDTRTRLEVLQEPARLDCHAENGRRPMVARRWGYRHQVETVGRALAVE